MPILCTALLVAAAAPHDVEFWKGVVAAGCAVPAGEDVGALLDELAGHAGDEDPLWRDELAYTITERWVRAEGLVPDEVLRRLVEGYLSGLEVGIGARGEPSVLRRSFSALNLATLVARDSRAAFLDDDGFARLLERSLAYLAAERDLRGYAEPCGWMHSVAHTADLLRRFAQSPRLDAPGQERVLTAIADKVGAVDEPLVFGEDSRLAAVVLALIAREDFPVERLGPFVDALLERARQGGGLRLDLARFHRARLASEILEALVAALALEARPSAGSRAALELLAARLGGKR